MDLNHVTLTGTLERHPITRCADHGTPQVSFTLRVDAPGPAGQRFTLCVPCEASGSAAAHAGELTAGTVVLVAGTLKWTSYTDKQGQQRTSLCVLARLVKRLAPAAVAAAV
jgi:single-stranded DNA-binding protein